MTTTITTTAPARLPKTGDLGDARFYGWTCEVCQTHWEGSYYKPEVWDSEISEPYTLWQNGSECGSFSYETASQMHADFRLAVAEHDCRQPETEADADAEALAHHAAQAANRLLASVAAEAEAVAVAAIAIREARGLPITTPAKTIRCAANSAATLGRHRWLAAGYWNDAVAGRLAVMTCRHCPATLLCQTSASTSPSNIQRQSSIVAGDC